MSLVHDFSLSPFEIRRERFREFCIFVARLHDKQDRDSGNGTTIQNGIAYKEAGDDWF